MTMRDKLMQHGSEPMKKMPHGFPVDIEERPVSI